jgi:uncharacterized protein (DUF2141 family)
MLELIKLGKFAFVIFSLSLAMGSYNLALAQQTNHASVKITVAGLQSDDGNVRISVFKTEQSWLKEHVYTSTVIISNEKCEQIIENVPYGDYAVSVYHDENANGEMDTGFMRIPKEPIGFSNNAKASFGPPKWSDAKLSIISPSVEITVKVE